MPGRVKWSIIFVLVLLPAVPPTAGAGEVFFSEYVEGNGNNKALEINNGTGAAVVLVAYAVQFFFNDNSRPDRTLMLSGTLAPGQVFVLAQAAADAALRERANLTAGGSWFTLAEESITGTD